MRISDWSSDVCSSDLPRVRDYPAEQRVIGADGLGAVARPRPFRRWLMCFVWAVAPSVVWSWQWLPALPATEGSICAMRRGRHHGRAFYRGWLIERLPILRCSKLRNQQACAGGVWRRDKAQIGICGPALEA